MHADELALELHKRHGGKIAIALRDRHELTRERLSAYYTPGVGAVAKEIAAHPEALPLYTWTNNLVAVISDGSSVLGLGNIGPKAALPVMEGKAMLFKRFAEIDSVPIVLDVHTADEIVETIAAIAPSFGAINLEDIAAPTCFEVEERLIERLVIPVMHDDQHGTATVVLAGLMNAAKVTGRNLATTKIVLVGAGAAGVAIARLIHHYARSEIIAVDTTGIIHTDRPGLNPSKQRLAAYTNGHNLRGSLAEAVAGADVLIGVSRGQFDPALIAAMAKDPIIFALANPQPEILPDVAKAAGAAVVATGRSDFPNQINNALAFPGIFRGALDHHVQKITDAHKIAAAEAIAGLVPQPAPDEIIPSVFDERLVPAIAAVVR